MKSVAGMWVFLQIKGGSPIAAISVFGHDDPHMECSGSLLGLTPFFGRVGKYRISVKL